MRKFKFHGDKHYLNWNEIKLRNPIAYDEVKRILNKK